MLHRLADKLVGMLFKTEFRVSGNISIQSERFLPLDKNMTPLACVWCAFKQLVGVLSGGDLETP